jgi:flavodoxin
MTFKYENCLIAYFSRKGDNYVSGRIVNLSIGNTEVVAKMIREMTEGDLFSIDPATPYPADYTETTRIAQKEKSENARPALTSHVENMNSYSVVFLGYPNWWGTMPMPVFTFLESYDFSGKTIVPFCTHEGSGLGRSEKDIESLCPKATILKGLAILGSSAKTSEQVVSNWVNQIVM